MDTWLTVNRANRARCVARTGNFAAAEPVLLDSYNALVELVGADHRRARTVASYLADLYTAWNRPDEAATWTARAAE